MSVTEIKTMAHGRNQHPILQFQPFVSRMPGSAGSRHWRSPEGVASLSRPAVHPNERHILFGTENAEGPQTLTLFDLDVLEQSMLGNPVVSQATLPKGVISSQWIGRDRAVIFSGNREDSPTTMEVYRVDPERGGEIKLQEGCVVQDAVREMAMKEMDSNFGVYGGAENKLSICDFNLGLQPTKTLLTETGVSSVRWTAFHGGTTISCTTEAAEVNIFDINSSKDTPSWTYKGNLAVHKALYTHCQVTEYQLILGYEDNFMEAIDIRMPQVGINNHMTGTFDPFCHMIGDMHYREASNFLLVCGMADFSVFKQSDPMTTAKLWCHSTSTKNTNKNDTNAPYNGAFVKDDWIVCTHQGLLSYYKL